MTSLRSATVAISLLAPALASAADSAWAPVSDRALHFSVSMPSGSGRRQAGVATTWLGKQGGITYSLGVAVPPPADLPKTKDAIRDQMAQLTNGFVSNASCKGKLEPGSTSGGSKGPAELFGWVATCADGSVVVGRSTYQGGRHYLQTALVPKGAPPPVEAKAFFESLRITP